MKTEVKMFEHGELGSIRAVQDENNEPWFVAKDVCEVLGLNNVTEALRGLDDDERDGFRIPDSTGRMQQTPIINESGLYSLILRSRKPEARRFKKWVTAEVLPSIRKHGMYATPQTVENMLSDPETAIKMLQTIKDERAKNAALEAERDRLKPKADTMETLMGSDSALPMGSTAKALYREFGVGRNTLFKILREEGVLMANNEPKQYFIDRGYFRVVERRFEAGGEMRVGTQTFVYQKGVLFIANLLRRRREKAA